MAEETKLIDSVKGFETNSYAILYSPKKCYLALFDGTNFVDEKGMVDIADVYEARVFNAEKELRWLNGKSVVLSDSELRNEKDFVDIIPQKYLIWGQSTNVINGNWTQFAEARIGAFFIPKKIEGSNKYAQFTAVEYLKEFEDGNVAVFEERLTGIELYSSERKGGNENA